MVNIKEILEKCVELNCCKTLGELNASYFLNEILFEEMKGPIWDKSKEAYDEFKRVFPVWKEKYGFNEDTEIKDVLKVL